MTTQGFDHTAQGGRPLQGSRPRTWGTTPGTEGPSVTRTPLDRSAAPTVEGGVRRLRHLSNWTLAALIVGVGAASAAFARTVGVTAAPASVPAQAPGTAGSGVTPAASGSVPQVSSPIAATTASGVVIPATGSASGRTATGRPAAIATYRGDT